MLGVHLKFVRFVIPHTDPESMCQVGGKYWQVDFSFAILIRILGLGPWKYSIL